MRQAAISSAKAQRRATSRGPTRKILLPVAEPNGANPRLFRAIPGIFVFLAAWLIVYYLSRFNISLDEGIYLYGAERVLAGQHIYRDFFALTGPGTFWLYAVWLKVFSATLAAAHALLALEIASMVTCLYLIVDGFLDRLGGIATASAFVALLMPFTHRLYVNHRWGSACCATIALALLLLVQKKAVWTILAGIFAGCAIIFTPPTGLVALAVAVLLLFQRGWRRQALWFAAGACIPVGIAAAVLAAQGALAPMLQTFSWVGRHYSRANRVPYGYEPPLTGAAAHIHVSLLRRAAVRLPAALPLTALAIYGWLRFQHRSAPFRTTVLLASGIALTVSCYPRVAADNLLFAAPLLLCFLFLAAAPLAKPGALRGALGAILAASVFSIFWTVTGQPPTVPVDSEMGIVNTGPREARNIEFATAVIHASDSLFVYPYQPIWYSLTGAVNPTRFDFLQPGMMTLEDETVALGELKAHPPEWMIWLNLPPRTVLAVWPHSDRATLQFRRIEQFIRTRYSQVRPPDPGFRYSIAIFHRIDPD